MKRSHTDSDNGCKTQKINKSYEELIIDHLRESGLSVYLIDGSESQMCEDIISGKRTDIQRGNTGIYQKISVGDSLLLSDKSIIEFEVTEINDNTGTLTFGIRF